MSTMVHTDEDTGRREYWIEQATPPRWMRSLTTILKCAANENLVYAAGRLGMEATRDLGHELAQLYVPGEDLLDFGFQLEALCATRFGRSKKYGTVNPPHVKGWRQKADTGSAAHNAIEREIKLRLGLPAPKTYDMEKFTDDQQVGYAKAMAAWDAWKLGADFTPLASESVVWVEGEQDAGLIECDQRPFGPDMTTALCRYDYAARIDLAATIEGKRGIWDVKTGKVDKDGPYPSQWLQVEAQRRAANARNLCGGGFDVAGIIHVPAAGGPVKVYANDGRDRDADFAAFDHLNGYSRWAMGPVGRGK